MSNFKQELELRGLKLTPSEIKKLKLIAFREFQIERVKPVLKKEKFYHYLILNLAFQKASYELMFAIYGDKHMKQKLKQNFLKLKNYVNNLIVEFEKTHKEDTVLLEAFRGYSDDLCEMVYQHLDRINEQ